MEDLTDQISSCSMEWQFKVRLKGRLGFVVTLKSTPSISSRGSSFAPLAFEHDKQSEKLKFLFEADDIHFYTRENFNSEE